MHRRHVIPIVSFLLLVAAPAAAVPARTAPTPGSVRIAADLGPGEATAINRHGHVAGHTDGVPWVWTHGQRRDLPQVGSGAWPTAINSVGDVVGSAMVDGHRTGVLWRDGTVAVLDGFVQAEDINDRGDIVGYGPNDALHHGSAGTRVLPDLGLGAEAHGVNKKGEIVGAVRTTVDLGWPEGPQQVLQAAVWRDGVLENLTPKGDEWWLVSVAHDISDAGHITGVNHDGRHYTDAPMGFRLSPDGTFQRLGGGYAAYLLAVNRKGTVAGWVLDEFSGSLAGTWLPGVDLAGHTDEATGYRHGVKAFDLNDRGQVVGTAQDTDWQWRAVLWSN